MMRGRLISSRPEPSVPIEIVVPHAAAYDGERLLTSEEANTFLRRGKGFLQKRRSAGIDSPPYIQPVKNGAVRYRAVDLLKWEDEQLRSSSSEFA